MYFLETGLTFAKIVLNRVAHDIHYAYQRCYLALCVGVCIGLTSCSTTQRPSSSNVPVVANAQNGKGFLPPGEASSVKIGIPYRLKPVDWSDLEGWQEDALEGVMQVLHTNCNRMLEPSRVSANATINWQPVCSKAQALRSEVGDHNLIAVRAFFEQNFIPFQLSNERGNPYGLITGYYEPVLRGSRTRHAPYLYPLYRWPSRYAVGQKLPARAALLKSGVLDGEELVYVDDPIEAFFLQIQGSGRIVMDEGEVMRVGYNGTNGQPYRSIGRWLIDQGELTLSQTSVQGLRQWARAHPKQVDPVLAMNPRFVFFKEIKAPLSSEHFASKTVGLANDLSMANMPGPIGALGVPLTAQRSIAVDLNAVPLGLPVFLSTTRPASHEPLRRLVFAQDVGAAIRGPVRADYFWGLGDPAGDMAGRMKQQGRMWLLLPKP